MARGGVANGVLVGPKVGSSRVGLQVLGKPLAGASHDDNGVALAVRAIDLEGDNAHTLVFANAEAAANAVLARALAAKMPHSLGGA